jgi:uncharacterized protein DUF6088
MSIAATVSESIKRLEPGQIFGCGDLPGYRDAPEAVVRALSRLTAENKLKRLAKGRYYVPKQGVLGELKPTDSELIRNALYRNGQLNGYVTGPALYNRLGLTTQMPKTITVAINGARQDKDFGTIRIKSVTSRAPVRKADVPLLQYLDALRDIKKIPDSNPDEVAEQIVNRLVELSAPEVQRLQRLALKYYNAATRALLGLLLSRNQQDLDPGLRMSLNPFSRYTIGLNKTRWPDKAKWNVR